MKARKEFIQMATTILDIMDAYGVMMRTQLELMFPDGIKEIAYLIKNKRLFLSEDKKYLSPDETIEPCKPLVAAINVLLNVISKVSFHTVGKLPAQIIFVTHNGDYYEIIYVEQGKEPIIASIYSNEALGRAGVDTTAKRLVIVEDKAQIQKIKGVIPNILRFAVLKSCGSFDFYTNVEGGK